MCGGNSQMGVVMLIYYNFKGNTYLKFGVVGSLGKMEDITELLCRWFLLYLGLRHT